MNGGMQYSIHFTVSFAQKKANASPFDASCSALHSSAGMLSYALAIFRRTLAFSQESLMSHLSRELSEDAFMVSCLHRCLP